MVFIWHHFIQIVIIVSLKNILGEENELVKHTHWTVVESLAEEYPYIVALLDINKTYICTGIIINSKAVLTSGSCIQRELYYIAIGSAVLSQSEKLINKNNLYKIATTALHGDYTFELTPNEMNVTQMHSNIGLVFAMRPELDIFIPAADLGNYYASELRSKNLMAVGYGRFNKSGSVALQFQTYRQSPCTNPKWYYCICGYEFPKLEDSYESTFGEGAPVFFNSELVGVTAITCGTLELKSIGIKYNIFTVISAYVPWIEKTCSNITNNFSFRSKNHGNTNTVPLKMYILLAVSQVLN